MTKYEELLTEGQRSQIKIVENYSFKSNCKGMNVGSNIVLSKKINSNKERTCILAEELGHYYTSTGDILDAEEVANRKQELHARIWAFDRLIGLSGIIRCFKAGCHNMHEMAEFLDVTESFFDEAIHYYHLKYGCYVRMSNYIIYFDPYLSILEVV